MSKYHGEYCNSCDGELIENKFLKPKHLIRFFEDKLSSKSDIALQDLRHHINTTSSLWVDFIQAHVAWKKVFGYYNSKLTMENLIIGCYYAQLLLCNSTINIDLIISSSD